MNSLNHNIFVPEQDIKVQDIRDIKLELIESEPEPLHLYFTNGLARAKVENGEIHLTLEQLNSFNQKYKNILIDRETTQPECEKGLTSRKNYQQFYKKVDGKLVCLSCGTQYDSTHGIHYHLNHTICGFGDKERVAPKKDFRGYYARDSDKFVCLGCSQKYETIRGVHYHLNNKKCGKLSPDKFQLQSVISQLSPQPNLTSDSSSPENGSKRSSPKKNYLKFYKREGKICFCVGCGTKYQSIHGMHNHLNSTKCGFGEKFKSSPKTSYVQFYRKEEEQLICNTCNISYSSMHGMHYHLNSTTCGFGAKEGVAQKRNYQDFYTKEDNKYICNHCSFKVEYLQGIHRHLRNCSGYLDFNEKVQEIKEVKSPPKVIKTIIYSENENMNYIGHDESL